MTHNWKAAAKHYRYWKNFWEFQMGAACLAVDAIRELQILLGPDKDPSRMDCVGVVQKVKELLANQKTIT
jgi:hypothetical protein